MLIAINFAVECIALITVIVQYKKLKHTIYKYFLTFLLFIVIADLSNKLDWPYTGHSNLYISNISGTVSFLFYSIFLQAAVINHKTYKKAIRLLIAIILFCMLINMAFIQSFWKPDSITMLLQFSLIILIACLFFYQLMNSTESDLPLLNLPAFWLNTGLLFYYLFNFLFYCWFAYMAYKNNYHYYLLAVAIVNITNIILYSCLSVCFLCFNKKITQISGLYNNTKQVVD